MIKKLGLSAETGVHDNTGRRIGVRQEPLASELAKSVIPQSRGPRHVYKDERLCDTSMSVATYHRRK